MKYSSISFDERLSTECKEAARKPIYVRGHFRVVKGGGVDILGDETAAMN